MTDPLVAPPRRPGVRATAWLAGGTAYALLLLVAGWWLPVYGSESVDSSGRTVARGVSLVGENGVAGAVVVTLPLLTAVAVWLLLRASAKAARRTAWAVSAVLLVLCVLSLFSIGLLVVPVAVCLLLACGAAPAPADRD